jgi:hypothetical protein
VVVVLLVVMVVMVVVGVAIDVADIVLVVKVNIFGDNFVLSLHVALGIPSLFYY